MPDGALLVNVARGAVVVTDDLLAELRVPAGSGLRWTSPTRSRCRLITRCGALRA